MITKNMITSSIPSETTMRESSPYLVYGTGLFYGTGLAPVLAPVAPTLPPAAVELLELTAIFELPS